VHESGQVRPPLLVPVTALEDGVDALARESGFSGVASVDRGGEPVFAKAYGLADQRRRCPRGGRRLVPWMGLLEAPPADGLLDDGAELVKLRLSYANSAVWRARYRSAERKSSRISTNRVGCSSAG